MTTLNRIPIVDEKEQLIKRVREQASFFLHENHKKGLEYMNSIDMSKTEDHFKV